MKNYQKVWIKKVTSILAVAFLVLGILPTSLLGPAKTAEADAGLAAAINMFYNPVSGQLTTFGAWHWTNSACPTTNGDKYVGVAVFINGANPNTAATDPRVLDSTVHLVTGTPCTSPANVIPSGNWTDNGHDKTTNPILSSVPTSVCVVAYDVKKDNNGNFVASGNHSLIPAGTIPDPNNPNKTLTHNGDNSYNINNPDQYLAGACVTPTVLPTLTIVNTVVNNNGGTKTTADFPLFVNGNATTSGTQNIVTVGSFTVSETTSSDYSASVFGGDCAADGSITLSAGQNATCTITNDDIAPSLTLNKEVNNDAEGGTAVATDWTLFASGPSPISGAGSVSSDASFKAGTYVLSESTGPANYNSGTWSCTGNGSLNNSSLILSLAQNAVCKIINTFVPPIPDNADLSVTKSVDNASPQVGSNIVYTITATNNGLDDATGVAVTDALPAGLTWVSDDSSGSYVPGTGVWTVGGLANKASATLHITATVTNQADLEGVTNTASVTANEEDANQINNSSSVDINPQDADLSIEKTVDHESPAEGSQVEYTITVTNNGADDATNVVVSDPLPSGLTFVSSIPDGAYNSSTGEWTVGDLSNGASATLQITASVNNGTADHEQINTATVTSDTYDGDQEDNSSSVSLTPVLPPPATLTIVKNTINGDGTFTFKVTDHDNMVIPTQQGTGSETTTLSPGTYTITENSQANWTLDGAPEGGRCIYDNESVGQSVTNGEQITIDSGDQVTCTFTNTFHPPTGSLTINKITVGGDSTFEVTGTGPTNFFKTIDTANNAGSVTVTGLLVGTYSVTEESLPTGWSQTENNCSEVSVTADQTASCTITNTFTPTVDLEITKTVGDSQNNVSVDSGSNVTFAVTVTNNGPDDATGVVVTDALPAGLTYVSDDGAGAYVSGTGIWTVGNLANGASKTLNITATATGASQAVLTNTATTTDTTVEDSNDSDSATVTINTDVCPNLQGTQSVVPDGYTLNNDGQCVLIHIDEPSADLGITKVTSDSSVGHNDNFTYTLTVTNHGPDTANSVVVNDSLPSGVSFVSSDASQGSYDSGTGVWNVGTLGNGETATLAIEVNTDVGSGTITNTATVSMSSEIDIDHNTDNDSASVDVRVQSGGGGGGGGTVGGGKAPTPPVGQVLGAETEALCAFDINTYMRRGYKNNTAQVKVLQWLLNKYANPVPPLTIDGLFGKKTEVSVKAFQAKYADEILKNAWGINAPTGIFFRSTLAKAKNLECPAQATALPVGLTNQYNWSKSKDLVPPPAI